MSYEGSRGGRGTDKKKEYTNRTGAARRTYPMDGAGPRVGRVATNVPRAERVDGGYDAPKQENRACEGKGRAYGGSDFARQYQDDPKKRNARGAKSDYRAPKQPPIAPPVPVDVEEGENQPMPEGLENLLCGRNPIREALRAGRPVEKLLVASGDLSGAAREIVKMAKDAGVIVQMVDRSRLDQIYPSHQGLLAYVAAVPYSTVEEMLEDAQTKGEEPFLIVLDGITDPHNLGAIIRSAECVGAHGVIIPERRASGLTPVAAKAAAGAMNYMKIARVTNINRTIDMLKEQGIWIVGTSMDGQNAFKADLSGAMALVIGSEGEGISRLTMEKCDIKVTLPMKGHIDSLNASVAAGVMMYEIARARAK